MDGAIKNYESVQATIDASRDDLGPYQTPLTASDKVMVMQGWNKALAFKTAFGEALLTYWRLLCCEVNDEAEESDNELMCDEDPAMHLVESSRDPIAVCLQKRIMDAEELLIGLLDGALRRLCPENQIVQREAYRATIDEAILQRVWGDKQGPAFKMECETVEDYLKIFARCGVQPKHWVHFVTAFHWTLKNHTPYFKDDDQEDIDRGIHSAYIRSVVQQVSLPAIEIYEKLKSLATNPLYIVSLPKFWGKFSHDQLLEIGQSFYRTFLGRHPEMMDLFSRTDLDALSVHLVMSLDVAFRHVDKLGSPGGTTFRDVLEHLGDTHRKIGVPTHAYALMGATLVDSLQSLFEEEEQTNVKTDEHPQVSAADLRSAFLTLYIEIMSMVYYPMSRQEKQLKQARDFYRLLRDELKWTEDAFSKRWAMVETEIMGTGTYIQTSEELEWGMRIAWRNSAKCIGRIAWNTLKVNDCRHMNHPRQIFKQVKRHLLQATSGTNIQSVMTVFKPQSPYEPFGVRFWSSQLVRYAAYRDLLSGNILGDPANLELTNYLIMRKLWKPPAVKSGFDVLPLVIKVPFRKRPYVYQLPKEVVFEVDIEHPKEPAISRLGYKWTTVPAISDFKINLGGVVYQNMPFNGWFVSTEIARNLMERYDVGPAVAGALGLDISSDPMWRQRVFIELEIAVNYSFQKNGYTIVDPMTAGRQYCTHVQRERENFGRECPAQWSWIGGLVGPTNPTWHLEMRDFLVNPQFEYTAHGYALHTALEGSGTVDGTISDDNASVETCGFENDIPRVLILYGSETGKAEAAARRLRRELRILKPTLLTLNEASGLDLVTHRQIDYVVAICSTFGKGDAPGNAQHFMEKEVNLLRSNAKYAVLALGSTLYPDFCQAGVKLDAKLMQAGLECFASLKKADEACGDDGVISEWIHFIKRQILPASLEREITHTLNCSSASRTVHRIKFVVTKNRHPILSRVRPGNRSLCLENEELLTEPSETKSVRKLTFESTETFESGDHLTVYPENSDEAVEDFLRCFESELISLALTVKGAPVAATGKAILKWIASVPFEIECEDNGQTGPAEVFFETPVTLQDLLKSCIDLSLGTKQIHDVIELATKSLDQYIGNHGIAEQEEIENNPLTLEIRKIAASLMLGSSDNHTSDIDSFAATFPTMVSFLMHFKEILLPSGSSEEEDQTVFSSVLRLADLLSIMPRLQPRLYSISSSDKVSKDNVSITVGVLRTKTSKGVRIDGVCSNYLASLAPGQDAARITVRKSSFRLPEDPSATIWMVCAGTGIAPMIAFLTDRHLMFQSGLDIGPVHLFFGCRTESDFLYKDLIQKFVKEGWLALHLALSRSDPMRKTYVQDLITGMGLEAYRMLRPPQNTYYYVCGDARMADGCYESVITTLRLYGRLSRVAATQYVQTMRVEGRWQTDVWGIVTTNYEVSRRKQMEQSKRMAAKVWLTHFQEVSY